MGQVSYSDDAIADLVALRQYIGLHNPSAANRVAARIIQSVNRLQTHPKFGKPGRVEGTRELIIPKFPYSIVYEENQGDCMVLRVLHQAMQWPAETSQDN
jgi:toxin ParE1/3/4